MSLLGQGEAWRRQCRQARILRMPHALVLEGERGVGKSTAARALARALLCEAPESQEACGTCSACKQVETGNHPDFHAISVLPDKREIAIDQVRDLQTTLQRSAMQGRARVALIDPADDLNEAGQNALLKTLEEPGANTFLLLVTARPEGLLPTVRSRVARLRIAPLSEDEVASALTEQEIGPAEERLLAARLSRGSLGLAGEILAAEICPRHQQLVVFLEHPTDMSAVSVARQLLAGTADRVDADYRVRLLLWCAREQVRQTISRSLAPEEGAAYGAGGFAPWARILDRLLDAEADLDLRIAAEQVLCHALLHIQEELGRVVDREP